MQISYFNLKTIYTDNVIVLMVYVYCTNLFLIKQMSDAIVNVVQQSVLAEREDGYNEERILQVS